MTTAPRVFPGLTSGPQGHGPGLKGSQEAARNLLLQCATCGALGTVFGREGDLKALRTYDRRTEVINAAWRRCKKATLQGDEAEARRWERKVRDLRSGSPVLCHVGCGGICRAYDLGSR